MNQNELKKAAAEQAVSFVPEGKVLGVGTGSTVDLFIDALARSGKSVPACISSSGHSSLRVTVGDHSSFFVSDKAACCIASS